MSIFSSAPWQKTCTLADVHMPRSSEPSDYSSHERHNKMELLCRPRTAYAWHHNTRHNSAVACAIGRPRNGKRQAPLELVTVGGTAPPLAKKPALSKLKGLIEREGLNPAPDKRRVPLRQQPAGLALPQPRPRPKPQFKSVKDIPSLAEQAAEQSRRPRLGNLPQPDFAADKYPAPPPRPSEPASAHRNLQPEDSFLTPAEPPPQPPPAAAPPSQQPLRRVVQLSPPAAKYGPGPAWVRRRAGVATAATAADEVTARSVSHQTSSVRRMQGPECSFWCPCVGSH